MNILEILGTATAVAITGISLVWVLLYNTRPPKNGVVQKRKWKDMSESERLESIAIDGTESVKRRAMERADKRRARIIKWENRP
jgi:hypothetical protein